MNILLKAKKLGAVINSDALCLPAISLTTFLHAAIDGGWKILYVECLYFHEAEGAERGGTEPSMELSINSGDFSDPDELLGEASRVANKAIERAMRTGTQPFFEVGLYPELNLRESEIKVRR